VRTYVTNIGTPNQKRRKEYATPAGAKRHCRSKLGEHKEWCDAFNIALGEEVSDASKEIDQMNITTLPPNSIREWAVTDDHSGLTFVVELWVEEST
jgi:hypothetical protein